MCMIMWNSGLDNKYFCQKYGNKIVDEAVHKHGELNLYNY